MQQNRHADNSLLAPAPPSTGNCPSNPSYPPCHLHRELLGKYTSMSVASSGRLSFPAGSQWALTPEAARTGPSPAGGAAGVALSRGAVGSGAAPTPPQPQPARGEPGIATPHDPHPGPALAQQREGAPTPGPTPSFMEQYRSRYPAIIASAERYMATAERGERPSRYAVEAGAFPRFPEHPMAQAAEGGGAQAGEGGARQVSGRGAGQAG